MTEICCWYCSSPSHQSDECKTGRIPYKLYTTADLQAQVAQAVLSESQWWAGHAPDVVSYATGNLIKFGLDRLHANLAAVKRLSKQGEADETNK